MHPSAIIFMDAFPLSPTGKVDNRALLGSLLNEGAAAPVHDVTYVPPATETEQALYRIWSDLLGRQNFSVTDTFFDLGGHSLLGLRLFNRLEMVFGFVSPLAVLFEHPTIRELAAEIDRKSTPAASPSDELFATLRKEGRNAPLFLIHGGDGGVMFYHALVAKMVGLDCPVYAIESPSLNRRDLRVPDLDTLVTNYLEMIRSKQPEGPYRIGGYSFGGIVAFEIARRLHAREHRGKTRDLRLRQSGRDRRASARACEADQRRVEAVSDGYAAGAVRQDPPRITSRRSEEREHREKVRRLSAAWNDGSLTETGRSRLRPQRIAPAVAGRLRTTLRRGRGVADQVVGGHRRL